MLTGLENGIEFLHIYYVLQSEYLPAHIAQWQDTDHAEGAVYKAPPDRYPPHPTHDKGKRYDEQASDHPKLYDPDIAHGIAEDTDEKNSNDNVCKCQPIVSIEEYAIATE